jgi:S1-C subfamily serine protease
VGGDLIMSIDGKPVDRSDAIARTLAHKRSGDTIELTVFRAGKTVNVRVKLVDTGDVL